MRMGTVWERLGDKRLYPLPMPFLEAKYSFSFSSLQLMPCLWRYFSKLGAIRNFTVKKCSVMQRHSCEAYSYAKEFSLVRKVALV